MLCFKTALESSAKKRTVFNDFKVVRTNVTESNVMVYGDFDTGHEKLSAFIGYRQCEKDSTSAKRVSRTDKRKVNYLSKYPCNVTPRYYNVFRVFTRETTAQ